MVWYENWESWGMTQGQIESELETKAKARWKDVKALYESWDALLKEMSTKMVETEQLSFRLANWTDTNHLTIVRTNLKRELEYSQDLKDEWTKADLRNLARIIDRFENETLNNLIYEWGTWLVRDMVRRAWFSNYSYSDDGGVVFGKWAKGNLSDLVPFANRSVHEFYVTPWTNTPNGWTSERKVIWENNEFILDYSECWDEDRDAAMSPISHQLDEAVVTANRKYVEHTREEEQKDPNNYAISKIVVRVEKTTNWYRFRCKNFGESDWNDWRSMNEFPLCSGLKIYEKSSYEAGFSVRSARAQEELRQETLWRIDGWDWEISPAEKPELRKYIDFFPRESKLQNILEWVDDYEKINKNRWNMAERRFEDLEPTKISIGERSYNYYYNRFIVATENAVRTVLRQINTKNGVIRLPNPVDKNGGVHYMMNNFTQPVKINIWPKQSKCSDGSDVETLCLWDDLYNFIFNDDDLKEEYIEYLNNSIKSKYDETDELRQDDYEYHSEFWRDELSDDKLENVTSWLNILSGFFEDLLYSEDKTDDHELCYYRINQVIKMINRKKNNGEPVYRGAISDLVVEVWNIIEKNIWNENEFVNLIYWIVFGVKDSQTGKYDPNYVEDCYRRLSEYYNYVGNERQAMRLLYQKDANWNYMLKFGRTLEEQKKYVNYNDCINNLNKFKLSDRDLCYDGEGRLCMNNDLLVKFANLHTYDGVNFEKILIANGVLPKYYSKYFDNDSGINFGDIEDETEKEYVEKIQQCISKIKTSLKSRLEKNKNLKFSYDINAVQKRRELRIDELKKKEEKGALSDEAEKIEYQNLQIYKANPMVGLEIEKIAFENMKTMMFYTGIDDLIFWWISSCYAEITGVTNIEIYNDIKWLKGGGLSDRTIQIIKEVINVISEEAIWWFVSAWVWGAFSTLKLWAKLVALANRLGKWWKHATKIFESMGPRWANFRNGLIKFSESKTARLGLAKVAKTVDKTSGEFISMEAWKVFNSRMNWNNPIDALLDTNFTEDFKNVIKKKVCSVAVNKVYNGITNSFQVGTQEICDIIWKGGVQDMVWTATFQFAFSPNEFDVAYVLWAFCWQLLNSSAKLDKTFVRNVFKRVSEFDFNKKKGEYYCKVKNEDKNEDIKLTSSEFGNYLIKCGSPW